MFLQNLWPYFLSSSIFSRPAFVHSTCGGLRLMYTGRGQGPGPVPVKVRTWAQRVKLRENWHVQCTGVQSFTGSHTLTLIRSTWRHREGDIGGISDIMEQWPGDNQRVRWGSSWYNGREVGSQPAPVSKYALCVWVTKKGAQSLSRPSLMWCGLIWEVQGCVQQATCSCSSLLSPGFDSPLE